MHVVSQNTKMPKQKSSTSTNNTAKQISLKTITGIDGSLESLKTSKMVSQTDKYFADEMPEYFSLLEQIADDLQLSENITENYEGDESDDFIETVREIAEKLFNEIKHSIENTPIENQSKKTKFIKALIRIFSILLNANLNSAKKNKQSYKTKCKTCFEQWQGQGLNKLPTAQAPKPAAVEDHEVPEQETSKSQDQDTNNLK